MQTRGKERNHAGRQAKAACRPPRFTVDEALLVCILLGVGLALIMGQPLTGFVFYPGALLRGDWWRLFTHPFAHVSLYHLLLDGAAFLLLYRALAELGRSGRLLLAAAAVVGSLAAAAAAPGFATLGLCGLSGPAHGLMAVWGAHAVRTARNPSERTIGWMALWLPLGKSLFEVVSGTVLLGPFHVGGVGVPNPYTHAGGVVAALLAYAELAGLAPMRRPPSPLNLPTILEGGVTRRRQRRRSRISPRSPAGGLV